MEEKEDQVSRAVNQINSVKSIPANKYSDEEYEFLQLQYSQAQKSLLDTRSHLSDRDLELMQLQSKVEALQRA